MPGLRKQSSMNIKQIYKVIQSIWYGFSKYMYYWKPEKYNLVYTIEEMGFKF
uniref:Uncharacterized protein n=1 Tax=Arundo donax TaxID=35708 RepID=A0A0A9G515_ARUDO